MPKVSVILPVYNAEKYLKEAIDSILNQTFSDFELLLINDGSTDASEVIIASYKDPRIIYIKNEINKGLIYSLNRAIDLAQGEYIARMDADDIALPERLQKQVKYLETYPDVGIVATTILLIGETGKHEGIWNLDSKTISSDSIKRTMPWNCCLAHPSVTGKTHLFRKFKYNTEQNHIEDYDLWLRMLNKKIIISKIAEPLLLYRVHQASITQSNSQTLIPQTRIFNCKKRYLLRVLRGRDFSLFNFRVCISMFIDFAITVKKTIFRN